MNESNAPAGEAAALPELPPDRFDGMRLQIDNLLRALNAVVVADELVGLGDQIDVEIDAETARAVVRRRFELGGFTSVDDLLDVDGLDESTVEALLDGATHPFVSVARPTSALATGSSVAGGRLPSLLSPPFLPAPIPPGELAERPTFAKLLTDKIDRLTDRRRRLQGEIADLQDRLEKMGSALSIERKIAARREEVDEIDRELDLLDGDDLRTVFRLVRRNVRLQIEQLRIDENNLAAEAIEAFEEGDHPTFRKLKRRAEDRARRIEELEDDLRRAEAEVG